jgi:RNA ligase (TIGR02306 family)
MENNNSVCFIAKITRLNSIGGADKIEVAQLNGWNSIVQKNIHKEGDLVLCITTDAVIPQDLCDKWGVTSYLRKGNRVRTVKLKGVYSECILIPLFDLPFISTIKYKEDEDLMEKLGIYKYEPPIVITQDSKGKQHKYHQNPNFHIYYKFPNHKNVPNMFNEDDEVIVTRKIHGTNARYGIVKKSKLNIWDRVKKLFGNKYAEYEFVYGSHNVEKGSDTQGFYSTDVWKEIADKYDIKNKLWDLFKSDNTIIDNLIIYGEIYGEGIQGEKYSYGLKSKEFVGFDIEIDGNYITTFYNDVYFDTLHLKQVPKLYKGNYDYDKIFNAFVKDNFIGDTKIPHEGVVVKSTDGNRHKIAKIINPDYLIFGERNSIPDSH